MKFDSKSGDLSSDLFTFTAWSLTCSFMCQVNSTGSIQLPGITEPTNFAVGPVTLTTILYPQPAVDIRYSRRLPKKHEVETNISRAIFSRCKLVIFLNYYILKSLCVIACEVIKIAYSHFVFGTYCTHCHLCPTRY